MKKTDTSFKSSFIFLAVLLLTLIMLKVAAANTIKSMAIHTLDSSQTDTLLNKHDSVSNDSGEVFQGKFFMSNEVSPETLSLPKEVSRKSLFTTLLIVVGLAALFFFIVNYHILKHRANQKISEQKNQIHQLKDEAGQLKSLAEEQNQNVVELKVFKRNILDYFATIENQITDLNLHVINDESANQVGFMTGKMLDLYLQLSNQVDLINFENGELNSVREELNLFELIEVLKEAYSHQIQIKKLKIENSVNRYYIINSDSKLLEKLLRNLFDNAIKNTPAEGLISFSQMEDEKMLKISIWNEGQSIPKKHISSIFKKYVKLGANEQLNKGSAGLGLTISKYITDELGGEIGLEPGSGHGVEFWFKLPKYYT